MSVKPLIFGRDDSIFQMRRDRTGCDHPAKLISAPGKNFAVSIRKCDGALGATVQQSAGFGQCCVHQSNRTSDDHSGDGPNAPTEAPDQPEDPAQQPQILRDFGARLTLPRARDVLALEAVLREVGLDFGLGFGVDFDLALGLGFDPAA